MSDDLVKRDLTEAEIETFREELLIDFDFDGPISERIHDLCNMARKSISLQSALATAEQRGYERGLEDAAKWHEEQIPNLELQRRQAIADYPSLEEEENQLVTYFDNLKLWHQKYAATIRALKDKKP